MKKTAKVKTVKQSRALPVNIDRQLARLASFTELNPRPVIEIDFDGTMLDANISTHTFFPDLKKKGLRHPYLHDFSKIVKELKKHKKPVTREVAINGRWFRQVFYLISNFNSIHIYGSDITDRKKAQEELQKSELRYKSLFNKISEGYALKEAILDKKGRLVDYRFIDINPAFEQLVGRSRINVIGKTPKEIRVSHDQHAMRMYGQVIATGVPARFERHHTGVDKYYEVFAYKTTEKQFAVLYLDISHLKMIEKEKDNFISIMSHELRNPLMPITANVQFMQSVLAKHPEISAQIKGPLEIISRQSRNMADLLDDIMDISRLNHQKITLKIGKVDIVPIVHHAVETSMPFIANREQRVAISMPRYPLYANVDPLRFEQIVVNLVNNASKYTHPKGKISISCKVYNSTIRLVVKDNGIGMNAKKIEKIFELFSRASKPVMGIGGLGIGLNLVKNLVTMHKGTIEAKSKGKGKGSEFILSLPAALPGPNGKKRPLFKKSGIQKPVTKTATILVVDDNEDIKNTLARILEHDGYQVHVAANGKVAVALAKKHRFDAAVVDIGIPLMNGYKVAMAIRKMAKYKTGGKRIWLTALTGYGQEKDKELAKKAGFDHHLTKPVDMNRLLELIAKNVAKS